MFTNLIFSSDDKKRKAIPTFSNFCARTFGLLLKRFILLPESTSIRAINLKPSLRSSSRSSICLLTPLNWVNFFQLIK